MAAVIMGAIGLGLSILGSASSSRASKRAARAEREAAKRAKEAGEFTAKQYEEKAVQERAIGSQAVEDQAMAGKIVASNAKAAGVKSGAGGYENTIADIQGESDYRQLTALYNSEMSARDLEIAAQVARREGADAARGHVAAAAGYRAQANTILIQGAADVAGGASTLYERYGAPYRQTYNTGVDQVNTSLNGYESVRSAA